MHGKGFNLVHLGSPPSTILSGGFDLEEIHLETVQPPKMWSLYYYLHANAVTVNTSTYAVGEGDALLLSPGSRVAHAKVGKGTPYDYITFDMPGKDGVRGAVPTLVQQMQVAYKDWQRAGQRLYETTVPLRAFIWNFMCCQAISPAVVRQDLALYEAEEWIMTELGRRFTVTELAEAIGVSDRHLLRAFRLEHGVSVQEYIQRKRVQEAARLLSVTDLPVKAVASRVGFHDLQHFNKVMRMHTGVAPRAFKGIRALTHEEGGVS